MTPPSGIFIIADVPGALGARIAAIQRVHDPRLAALWQPHVTIIGSSGAGPILPDTPVDELQAKIAPVAQRTPPLELRFGAPLRFPDRDIVVLPLDPHGPLRALHEGLRAAGLRTYAARYPFTPHVTLTMYPPLFRPRELQLLAIRVTERLTIDRLRIVLTNEPQPAKLLLEISLGAVAL